MKCNTNSLAKFIVYKDKVCLSRRTRQINHINSSHVNDVDPTTGEDEFFIGSINDRQDHEKSKSVASFNTNDTEINFKIDTGAECDVISTTTIKQLSHKPTILPSTACLTAYNGGPIPVEGQCMLRITANKEEHLLPFIITNSPSVPILGVKSSKMLNLVKRIHGIAQ